jgi:hypothetical protein
VIKAEVLLLVLVAAGVLLFFFLRALSNLRSGSRIQRRELDVRRAADDELERLQAEIDSTRRKAQEEATRGKE